MKFTTRRLILRPITMKDIKDLVENINNLKVSRYMLSIPCPYAIKDAKWWINRCKEKAKQKPRTSYEFAIELKSERRIIGGCGLIDVNRQQGTAELGYWLGEKYWKQGIMTEATTKIIDFTFNRLKLRKLKILCFVENKASNGLAKKLGAKLEGTLRKHCRAKSTGKIHDENIYGLLKEEWKKRV
jgi:RimJ/RimL family protein N-acetyltransferase